MSRGICSLLVLALFGRATQKSRVYQFAVATEAMKPCIAACSDDLFGARDAEFFRQGIRASHGFVNHEPFVQGCAVVINVALGNAAIECHSRTSVRLCERSVDRRRGDELANWVRNIIYGVGNVVRGP